MAIAALSILGAKLKIALTSVRSRVRESLAKRLILYILYFLLKLTYFLVKSVYRQFKKINKQNYDTLETTGTYFKIAFAVFIQNSTVIQKIVDIIFIQIGRIKVGSFLHFQSAPSFFYVGCMRKSKSNSHITLAA